MLLKNGVVTPIAVQTTASENRYMSRMMSSRSLGEAYRRRSSTYPGTIGVFFNLYMYIVILRAKMDLIPRSGETHTDAETLRSGQLWAAIIRRALGCGTLL